MLMAQYNFLNQTRIVNCSNMTKTDITKLPNSMLFPIYSYTGNHIYSKQYIGI